MRTIHEPWNRNCPDCGTSFMSVQATGTCPSCQLVFDADAKGNAFHRRFRIGTRKQSRIEHAVNRVQKYLKFLQAGKLTADEFNSNLLLFWVDWPCECWIPAASEVPNDIAKQFLQYLDDYLLPLEYKPCPTCFMVGPFDPVAVEQKKVELEPRYKEVHNFWRQFVEQRGTESP